MNRYQHGFIQIIPAILISSLLFGAFYLGQKTKSTINTNDNTPPAHFSPTPRLIDEPTPQSYKKTPLPAKETPKPAASNLINCNISSNCGGGTKLVSKIECDSLVCCQVGNKWQLYPSNSSCTQAQEQYWKDYYARENDILMSELNKKYNTSGVNNNYIAPTNPPYLSPTQSLQQKMSKCEIEKQNQTAQKRYECETVKNLYPHETTPDAYRSCLSELVNLETKIYKECLRN